MLDDETLAQVTAELSADEGDRAEIYDDATGKSPELGRWTAAGKFMPTGGRVTVGVGLNIHDVPIPREYLDAMFDARLAAAVDVARRLVTVFDGLSRNRKAALVNLAYNLGEAGLAKFKNTLRAMNDGRWADAADGLEHSLWATQVQRSRSERVIRQVWEG